MFLVLCFRYMSDTNKFSRKQAEESILKDIKVINKRLSAHRAEEELKVDRAHVIDVLKRYADIVKSGQNPH